MIKLTYENEKDRLDFWVSESDGSLNIGATIIPHSEAVKILNEMMADLLNFEESKATGWDKFWKK